MARSRNIKPSLFKNEILGEADPLLTILFTGLWCLADREGRLEDRPKRIKAEIFPYRELTDFNGYLTELERLGFIHRYKAENTPIIQVLNFHKHQSPHKTERPGELPEYKGESGSCGLTDKQPLNNEHSTVKESLIPDSLNTDSLSDMSGKPDPASNGKRNYRQEAREILQFLNEKTGRNYQPVDSNLNLIVARLKENREPKTLRQVVANRCREWAGDDKMNDYLRPKTLFNATNFANYEGLLTNG